MGLCTPSPLRGCATNQSIQLKITAGRGGNKLQKVILTWVGLLMLKAFAAPAEKGKQLFKQAPLHPKALLRGTASAHPHGTQEDRARAPSMATNRGSLCFILAGISLWHPSSCTGQPGVSLCRVFPGAEHPGAAGRSQPAAG